MIHVRAIAVAAICECLLVGCSAGRSPKVLITFARSLPTEEAKLAYTLQGSFGTYGQWVSIKPTSPPYLIETSVNGKAADRMTVFVWAPGCESSNFEIKLDLRSESITKTYVCKALPSAVLRGQIQPSSLVRKRKAEVTVIYEADWLCNQAFSGLTPKGMFAQVICSIPQVLLGKAAVDANGAFTIELPALSPGPRPENGTSGHLEFQLSDKNSEDYFDVLPVPRPFRAGFVYPERVTLVPRRP